MTAEIITSLAAAVVTFTQLVKWAGFPDRYGPVAVLTFSALLTAWWGWAHPGQFTRENSMDFFMSYVAITMSAAGFFGFTRASSEAITKITAPPAGGAGGNATTEAPTRRAGD